MTFDMEKARALSERARAFKVYTVPGQTGYGVDHSKYPEYHAVKEICQTAFPCALDRISELESTAKADEARLIAAAEKARITYFGCDTPDHLADRILELESALIEEQACGLFNGPWCSDLPDDCGYDAEMNAARIEAHQQLRSEGKL